MRLEINRQLEIYDAPDHFLKMARRRLTIPNPEYAAREKHGRDLRGVPDTLSFLWQKSHNVWTAPRGFVAQAARMAKSMGIEFQLVQCLREKPIVEFSSKIRLRDLQQRAVNDMTPFQFGTLEAPTGSGKTVMALAMIALRAQPTLVIVHTKELLAQWVDRIHQFLGLAKKEVGIIGGGKKSIGTHVTVATYQSVRLMDESTVIPFFGHLVVDEVHRCPSTTFTEVVELFDTKYQLGLSATPYRRDGLTPLISWFVGEVKHRVPKEDLLIRGQLCAADVYARSTNWRSEEVDPAEKYAAAITDMTRDDRRNDLILDDVEHLLEKNPKEKILLLSGRVEHAEALAYSLAKRGYVAATLHGQLSSSRHKEEMARLKWANVVSATGSLIGEGFDLPSLTALFVVTPFKWSGRLLQYVGRVLRPAPGKTRAIVYDYIDFDEPVFFNQGRARIKTYRKEPGFKVHGISTVDESGAQCSPEFPQA